MHQYVNTACLVQDFSLTEANRFEAAQDLHSKAAAESITVTEPLIVIVVTSSNLITQRKTLQHSSKVLKASTAHMQVQRVDHNKTKSSNESDLFPVTKITTCTTTNNFEAGLYNIQSEC